MTQMDADNSHRDGIPGRFWHSAFANKRVHSPAFRNAKSFVFYERGAPFHQSANKRPSLAR
ncbi:hypothetical protein ACVBEH_26435, partial [Roseateles sp. GG27B]